MIKINGKIAEFPEDDREEIDKLSYYLLKKLIKDAGYNIQTVVQKLNQQRPNHQTTPQNLSNKLSRDTLKLSEFVHLVELCGYTISFDGDNTADDSKTFSSLVLEGYTDCESINYKQIVIVGTRAQEAAQFIESNLSEGMEETQEIVLLISANRQFGVMCKPIPNNPIS